MNEDNFIMRQLAPSIVRTFVPVLVGLIATLAIRAGVDIDVVAVEELLGLLVSITFYTVIRWLETNGNEKWGWLLGIPSAPVYPRHTSPAEIEQVIEAGNLEDTDLNADIEENLTK